MDLSLTSEINWAPKGGGGWTPLHMAAAEGNMKSLVTLLDWIKAEEASEGSPIPEIGARQQSLVSAISTSSSASLVSASAVAKQRKGRSITTQSKLELQTSTGDRAFHVALRHGQKLAARELVRAGCDVHAKGKNGETAAHICAEKDLAEELELLMNDHGVDPEARTEKGETVLHIACREFRLNFLEWLRENTFATYEFFAIKDRSGETCVHASVRNGTRAGLDWLLNVLSDFERQRDAIDVLDLFAPNKDKKDPAAVARHEGFYDCSDAIDSYRRGKHNDRKLKKVAQKKLIEASRRNNVRAVRSLTKKHGKYFDIACMYHPRSGNNALMEAVKTGSLDVVKWFLENTNAAKENPKTGETILQAASASGNCEMVEFLLGFGLDPDSAVGFAANEAVGEILSKRKREAKPANTESLDKIQHTQSQKEKKRQLLENWLLELDMFDWFEKLVEEGFDSLERVQHVDAADLEDWGMKKGYRRSFMKALDNLSKEPGSDEEENYEEEEYEEEDEVEDEEEEEEEEEGALSENDGEHRKLRNDIRDGEEVVLDGATEGNKYTQGQPRKFILKRNGSVYRCSCPHWNLQKKVVEEARTCTHLKAFRGEEAELRRIDVARTREFNARTICDKWEARVSGLKESSDSIPIVRRSSSNASDNSSSERSAANMDQGLRVLSFSELTFGQVIGEGSFGIVRAAEWRGMLVAVKELRGNEKLMLAGSNPTPARADASTDTLPMQPQGHLSRKSTSSSSEEWDLRHEASMMARVSHHENIVQFIGVLLTPRPCVVTKLMRGGSVEDMLVVPGPLNKRKSISEQKIVEMLCDAAAGILHLHSEGVIHRDIAARNLLVDENLRVRVADFGFARIKDFNRSKGYTSQHIGPIKWMAPEAMQNRNFSEKTDVFSFGVTLYEVICGKRPWDGFETLDVAFRVINGERLCVPDSTSQAELRQLVERCQMQIASERPSMKDVHRELSNLRHRGRAPSSASPNQNQNFDEEKFAGEGGGNADSGQNLPNRYVSFS